MTRYARVKEDHGAAAAASDATMSQDDAGESLISQEVALAVFSDGWFGGDNSSNEFASAAIQSHLEQPAIAWTAMRGSSITGIIDEDVGCMGVL